MASADAAVERAPGNSEYHRWLGRAYGAKADRTRSFLLARRVKGEFEQAVELDPSNIAARRDLLEFYLDAPWIVGGDDGKARDQVRAIALRDPVQGDLARARYFMSEGHGDQAAAAYGRVLAMKPPAADPYFEAAEFFARHRQADGLARCHCGGGTRGTRRSRGSTSIKASRPCWRAAISPQPGAGSRPTCRKPRRATTPPRPPRHTSGSPGPSSGRAVPRMRSRRYQRVLQLVPDQRAARDALDRLRSVR